MKPLPAQEQLPIAGGHATVSWRRHARARRITLRIDARHGQVVVTLPMRAGRAAGMALLAQNADWVADRLAALPDVTKFEAGQTVPIDGIAHPIRRAPSGQGSVWIADDAVHVAGEEAFLARRVADFLRREARRRLAVMVHAKAGVVGLSPRRVTVKDTRSRWGSCSHDGVLMFCWRLVMAPHFVQDYVVAHEVAHLRHMNHGAEFWALTNILSPHREAAVSWLHEHGSELLRVG